MYELIYVHANSHTSRIHLPRGSDRNVWLAALDVDSTVADPKNMPKLVPTIEHYRGQNFFYPHAPYDDQNFQPAWPTPLPHVD